jgi:site-specific DNA recombinase
VIPGSTGSSAVQLAVNKSKSYPAGPQQRGALSGLQVCGDCGDYMSPSLKSSMMRTELIYTYMCSTKERSQSSRCQMKN